MSMFMLFPMLLLGGGLGGANELLDYLQTDAYWKARNVTPSAESLIALIKVNPKAEDISALIKQLGDEDFEKREAATTAIAKKGPSVIPQLQEGAKSTDAEIADRSKRLISELSGGDTDPLVHKLMVIRSLGELKDKAALPVLAPLTASKEPFVAEYAKRAIATIEGKPYKVVGTAAETFEKDVWMLPKGVKVVAQVTMPGGGPLDWGKALDSIPAPLAQNMPKEKMLEEVQKGVLMALNHTGNIRIDGITMGVSGDPGNQSGFMVVFVRGQYNREKVKSTLKGQNAQMGEEEGIVTATPQHADGMKMLLASDDLFVIVGGPPNLPALPVKEVIAAIKSGKGTLSEDEEVAGLIKSANRKTGGWAVAQMTDTYRQGAPWLKPFDTVIAERISEKGKTTFKVLAKGKDADAIKAAVDEMNTGLEAMRAQMKQAGAFVPKPFIDFLDSLKIQADGAQASVTGSMEGGFESMLGTMLVPMMMMGGPGF